MIGRHVKRGSGISVLAARHDDDNDIYIYDLKKLTKPLFGYHKFILADHFI